MMNLNPLRLKNIQMREIFRTILNAIYYHRLYPNNVMRVVYTGTETSNNDF